MPRESVTVKPGFRISQTAARTILFLPEPEASAAFACVRFPARAFLL